MKIRKKGYWLLLLITIFFTILSIATLVPDESASKICMLGYKAHCTFAPISTLVCMLPAGIACFIRKRFFVSYK